MLLIPGIVCKPTLAAGSDDFPFWAIILISLAAIMTLLFLLCLICTISVITCPSIRLRHHWIRSYFPHLAFWWEDTEAEIGGVLSMWVLNECLDTRFVKRPIPCLRRYTEKAQPKQSQSVWETKKSM
ncbi:Hypothetical predicted protein [Pelobates cultripes]|uniref:Uncharacterized protein n=1 Tax=Pelobates cultripes TaxID=61616 RepID=A0AAD1SZE9_PELCU|nr:Hypothetical predicted protein [Pelobates cultripes]